jgi:wobble nucleotide-excising tRNase
MRGANIALSGGVPDFKTSLSEGDKRTLAFAFFIASTESTPDLANKIIIIDDPMCSFDLNRKQQTRTVLKRLFNSSKQLVIIAHDIHFLRSLRDDLIRVIFHLITLSFLH